MSDVANPSVFRNSALVSGLVSPDQYDFALRLARHRANAEGRSELTPIADRTLADILIEQSVLTPYQADQLCEGRTKLTLGPYLITDWIGQGGMGQVFKAVHQFMGRECAVKVLPISRATDEARASFHREIRMQAQLDCGYLVRAHDAGQDRNVHYLVTEYVPGMDLRRLVKANGAIPMHQAAKIIMQAALGLEYAHSQGLIHRDVKPGNILVTPEGIAKVSDIGLAGFAANLSDDPRAGKIVGTADYLSPEQIRTPLEVSAVCDIYSLGCTLYYSICGKVPFPGGDTNSKLKRHLESTPLHPSNFASNLSEEFVDVVAEMMEKDPSKRIQTAAEVAVRLEPWAGDAGSLTSSRLSRGPWQAPPPPSSDIESVPNDSLLESSMSSQETSRGNLGSSSIAPSSEPFSIGESSISSAPALPSRVVSLRERKSNTRMIVALTVAIVLPPALLIGAILGFLAHSFIP